MWKTLSTVAGNEQMLGEILLNTILPLSQFSRALFPSKANDKEATWLKRNTNKVK